MKVLSCFGTRLHPAAMGFAGVRMREIVETRRNRRATGVGSRIAQ
jgi:hypothetical protein